MGPSGHFYSGMGIIPEYHFRYRERLRRRLIIEADFEESRVVALMFLDNMY